MSLSLRKKSSCISWCDSPIRNASNIGHSPMACSDLFIGSTFMLAPCSSSILAATMLLCCTAAYRAVRRCLVWRSTLETLRSSSRMPTTLCCSIAKTSCTSLTPMSGNSRPLSALSKSSAPAKSATAPSPCVCVGALKKQKKNQKSKIQKPDTRTRKKYIFFLPKTEQQEEKGDEKVKSPYYRKECIHCDIFGVITCCVGCVILVIMHTYMRCRQKEAACLVYNDLPSWLRAEYQQAGRNHGQNTELRSTQAPELQDAGRAKRVCFV